MRLKVTLAQAEQLRNRESKNAETEMSICATSQQMNKLMTFQATSSLQEDQFLKNLAALDSKRLRYNTKFSLTHVD